jgi:cobalt-zinc-cadmium efflux system outer membrane protein
MPYNRQTHGAGFTWLALLVVTIVPAGLRAQAQRSTALDALLARADSANPSLQAVRSRVAAARARVGPAGAWPDPMLMFGIQNLPLGTESAASVSGHGSSASPSLDDPMTMRMIGLGQTVPYPGKLSLRREEARHEVEAALARVDASRLAIARDVRSAFFELAYIDRALEITERNRTVLADVIQITEAHLSVGTGNQADVLKARVEAARLGETASALLEDRRATWAQLNAILNRDDTASLPSAVIPDRIASAAVAANPNRVRFATQTLGARAADSPFPPLGTLEDLAIRQNPLLRESRARIAAQTARVTLAEKDYKPDIDVSLQYGQRNKRPDMITAQIAIPLPIHKHARQDEQVAEARAELAAMEADHRALIDSVRARVVRLVSDLERQRTQLALYTKAILPQGSAAATAALSSYQSGKADLLSALDNQSTLFAYETAYYRSLSDFAKSLAELEQTVGSEIIQ